MFFPICVFIDIDMDQLKAYLAEIKPSQRDNLEHQLKQADMAAIADQIQGIMKEEFKTELGIDIVRMHLYLKIFDAS